jgi:FMN phosphatase YigB (HAD superfamily)
MYGFSDVDLFKDAYMHLQDVSDEKYEIYLSHIIAYLIGTKKAVYNYIEVFRYEDWGTLQDWNIVLQERSTIIVNMDGLLFEFNEHYGDHNWKKELIPIQDNIDRIKKLEEKGAQIIILTSMADEYREPILDRLKSLGIDCFQLITECYQSHEVLIKRSDSVIPYPGCKAINISKNDNIEDYL